MYRLLYLLLNRDKFGLDKMMKDIPAEDLDSQHIQTVLE
jgi:hypothetical protein